MSAIRIYTDGSADNIARKCAGAFLVVDEQDNILHFDSFYLGDGTNIKGETEAVIKALEYAEKIGAEDVIIYHDYEGLSKWTTGEWKTKNETSVMYLVRFTTLKKRFNSINFVKVTAHSKDDNNNRVDRLAFNALKAGILADQKREEQYGKKEES